MPVGSSPRKIVDCGTTRGLKRIVSPSCCGDVTNPGSCALLLMAKCVANGESLDLFADLDAMEMYDPCSSIYIEVSYEQYIVDLKNAGIF